MGEKWYRWSNGAKSKLPGARPRAPQPCWRFVPRCRRVCPGTVPASAGFCCVDCLCTGPSVSENTHTHRHTQSVTRVLIEERLQVALKLLHLQRLPASAQLQLDVLLSQVPGMFLCLKPLLQGVLVTMEGHGDLREGPLPEKQLLFHPFYDQGRLLWEP